MLPPVIEEPDISKKEELCFDFGEIDFSYDVASKHKRMYQEVCDENMELLKVLTQNQKENHSQTEKLEAKISFLQKQLDVMALTLSEEKEKKQFHEELLAKDEIERRIGREELEKQLLEKESVITEQKLAIDRMHEDRKRNKQVLDEEKQKFQADLLMERAFSGELEYNNQQLKIQLKQNTEDSTKETEKLKNDLRDKDREIFVLKRQIESLLDDQICAQNDVKIKLTDKIKEIQALENLNKAIQNENTVLKKENEFFKVEKQELTKEVDENTRKLQSRNQELEELSYECEKSDERNKILLCELKEAELMTINIKGECESFAGSYASVLKELKEAQDKLNIIEEDNQEKNTKLSANKTRDKNVVSNLFKLLELSKVKDSKQNCLISWFRSRRNRNRDRVNNIMKPLSKAEEKYEIIQTLLSEFESNIGNF